MVYPYKTKSVPLKEIAFKVGFSDQSNFSRAFRQYYGVSPIEYSEEPYYQRTAGIVKEHCVPFPTSEVT